MGNKYDAEIDLKDMFFYALYKWRKILLGALVLSVLAGGYKILFNTLETLGEYGKPKEVREYEIKMAEYELSIASLERNQEEYQMRLEQQQAYMEKSVLMQILPFNVPIASMDIFVKLDGVEWTYLPTNTTIDPTDSLLNAYTSNFHSTIDWTPITELTGKEALYLKELIEVSTDYNSNTFTVTVKYTDGDTAQKILNILADQVMAKYQGMDSDVNKHTISVINCALTYSIDNSLADAQKYGLDIMSGYEQSILECQTEIIEIEEDKPSSPHGIRNFFMLGFAGGFILIMLFYEGAYIFGSKLHNDKELKDRYGYNLLGFYPEKKEKNTKLFVIDNALHKLEGSGRQILGDEAFHFIATNIKNLAAQNKKLLVTGTVAISQLQTLVTAISPHLKDFTLMVGGDMNHNTKTLMMMSECDGVILVEERYRSLITDIQKEQEGLIALDKSVIGYVMI